ncbi:hypothetical protein SAMN05443244_0400 [Terriglobus roseus]|uniref:Uncharacterized protein n=1 Tax=Terriglobus roseus TaxID=392734 RepID=A0A1H4J8E7_9BACT|nr:hypothetical protein SAMN05443244_0400 [Terriglobus roseus]
MLLSYDQDTGRAAANATGVDWSGFHRAHIETAIYSQAHSVHSIRRMPKRSPVYGMGDLRLFSVIWGRKISK